MVTWGANTTATFGTNTAAASAVPAPAAGGFSFGGATATAPATPPAACQPAPSNPPPLGAAPAAGGLFCAPAPAPAAGGLFGSTPATAPSGGLFGATPAPAAGGLFGSTAPAPAAGGLFGAPAPTPAFGAAAPAPAFGGAAFGTQQPQQQQQQQQQQYQQQQYQQANPHQAAMHAHQSASQRQEAARIEEAIYNLHSKYSPVAANPSNPALASYNAPSSLCAFTAVLYDPLPPEHRAQGHLSAPKPPHISNPVWNEALARNPDPRELMPVPLVGAPALHTRIVSQQEKANALASHAKKLGQSLQFLEKAARSSKDAAKQSNAQQEALRRRLMEVMRKVEIVRCMGQPTTSAEVESRRRLGEIARQAGFVGTSLADLEERGRQQARTWRTRGATTESRQQQSSRSSEPLREQDKVELFQVLNEQRLGMERLGHIVKKEVRDVGILKEELEKASSGRAKALPPPGAAIFGGR
eukprot:CAMPEP_0201662950 /NCGR_PEP_ID=MMETSP0494-20130426/4890_1 /ASSEMBLY_ACC=CAM_ASM_000839 /TAXON_ID=420259 /ORGANISM="Thalassiosira gravida, Strain GMp14c1" /LENGTH=469 /DNA_ID=CAMNT_0048141429 /DNA_START=82 /DNA_END=1491 /DNA_ORIENTATION=-